MNFLKPTYLVISILLVLFTFPVFHVQAQEDEQPEPNPVQQEDLVTIHLSGGDLGIKPLAVTVNADLNLIAVANDLSNNIDVIDGETNQIIVSFEIDVNESIVGIAENIDTQLIYIAIADSADVEVLNAANGLVVDVIKLGHVPSAIDVNIVTNKVFVANKEGGSVTIIDGATGLIEEILDVGGQPTEISVNNAINFIYVGHEEREVIDFFDLDTSELFTEVATSANPSDIDINGPVERIYVSESTENGLIFVINGFTSEVVDTIQLVDLESDPEASNFITGMTVNFLSGEFYAISKGKLSDSFFVIDGDDNSVLKEVELLKDDHFGIVNLGNDFVYVSNENQSTISIYDNIRQKFIFELGSSFDGLKVGINDRSNTLYVTSANNVGVRVINASTNIIEDTIRIPVGNSDVGVDDISNLVYFAFNDLIQIVDGSTNEVVSDPINAKVTLNSETSNDSTVGTIAVNSQTHRIYVGTFNEAERIGKIKIFDGNTKELLSEINVGGEPSIIKINESTNRIYVSNGSAIVIIDGNINRILTNVNLGGPPDAIGINSRTDMIYAGSGKNLFQIDGGANSIRQSVLVSDPIAEIEINEENDRVYFSKSEEDTIDVDIRDGSTLEPFKSVLTDTDNEVIDIGFNPNTNLIYVIYKDSEFLDIAQDNNSLELLDAELEVLFDPEPAVKNLIRNKWEFRVTINELNGVDFRVDDFTIETLGFLDEKRRITYLNWFDDCGRSQERGELSVIPGFGTVCGDIGLTLIGDLGLLGENNPVLLWTFRGTDEHLTEIEGSGEIELLLNRRDVVSETDQMNK